MYTGMKMCNVLSFYEQISRDVLWILQVQIRCGPEFWPIQSFRCENHNWGSTAWSPPRRLWLQMTPAQGGSARIRILVSFLYSGSRCIRVVQLHTCQWSEYINSLGLPLPLAKFWEKVIHPYCPRDKWMEIKTNSTDWGNFSCWVFFIRLIMKWPLNRKRLDSHYSPELCLRRSSQRWCIAILPLNKRFKGHFITTEKMPDCHRPFWALRTLVSDSSSLCSTGLELGGRSKMI